MLYLQVDFMPNRQQKEGNQSQRQYPSFLFTISTSSTIPIGKNDARLPQSDQQNHPLTCVSITMKTLWKRAAGKIKDRNSLWRTLFFTSNIKSQPDLEAAIIKATSHDHNGVDYKNARRVFNWVRTSPPHLMLFLRTLTRRTKRTRNWVVALKSLILFHGVLCTKAPGTRKIGRLPFDLSDFQDKDNDYTRSDFVRAYFAFADLKSAIYSAELQDEMTASLKEDDEGGSRPLWVRVQRWQDLLDAVLDVRPNGGGGNEGVIVEAMDCMVIEVFELYSKICDGMAEALMKIYKDEVGKQEASMALDILHKANRQGRDLSDYFHFCTKIGILRLTECPQIHQIPEEDFFQLKRIINGEIEVDDGNKMTEGTMVVFGSRRDMVEFDMGNNKALSKTVITDKWEVFDDEEIYKTESNGGGVVKDPFEASLGIPPGIQFSNPFIDYGGYTAVTTCN